MRISDWSSDVCSSDLLGGHELHAAVEKLLLGIEHIKDITRADAILGADAFKGELIGSDCGFGRLDHGLRRLIARIGRPRFRDDTAFDEYGLLERLALKGGGASNFGCWQAALIERNCCRKSDGCGGLRLLEYAPGKAARSEEHTSELQSLMRP